MQITGRLGRRSELGSPWFEPCLTAFLRHYFGAARRISGSAANHFVGVCRASVAFRDAVQACNTDVAHRHDGRCGSTSTVTPSRWLSAMVLSSGRRASRRPYDLESTRLAQGCIDGLRSKLRERGTCGHGPGGAHENVIARPITLSASWPAGQQRGCGRISSVCRQRRDGRDAQTYASAPIPEATRSSRA